MTIDLKELLREHRKAVAALAAAEAHADAEYGNDDPPEGMDAWVERWHGPVDRAIGRLRAAVLLLNGRDPHEREFGQPCAAVVDGTLLVATCRKEDCRGEGLVVVDADDVAGLG